MVWWAWEWWWSCQWEFIFNDQDDNDSGCWWLQGVTWMPRPEENIPSPHFWNVASFFETNTVVSGYKGWKVTWMPLFELCLLRRASLTLSHTLGYPRIPTARYLLTPISPNSQLASLSPVPHCYFLRERALFTEPCPLPDAQHNPRQGLPGS